MNASYKRYPLPVETAGEETTNGNLSKMKALGKGKKVLNQLGEAKKEEKVITDMEKMKNLIFYNRKTQ